MRAWAVRALVAAALTGVAVLGVRTVEGLRETRGRAERLVATAEAALRGISLLSDDELARLRRSLNARHVALGESLGVAPVDSLGAVPPGLVRADTLDRVVVLDGTYSDPLLTRSGVAALDAVAVRFQAGLAAAGAPAFRPVATSLFRSAESQAALRRVNANAAVGRSSHEFGTTFDLSYRRFQPVQPGPVEVSPRVPALLRGAVEASVQAETAAQFERLAADYPARLDALLGRALIGLEDSGQVVALRERNQTVYHVTTARRLGAE